MVTTARQSTWDEVADHRSELELRNVQFRGELFVAVRLAIRCWIPAGAAA